VRHFKKWQRRIASKPDEFKLKSMSCEALAKKD